MWQRPWKAIVMALVVSGFLVGLAVTQPTITRRTDVWDFINGFKSNSGTQVKEVISGSATYDPASLVDGAGATTTVTVTGAALGDFAVASFSVDLAGITLTAYVSAADTCGARFQNESTGTVDLASGTLTCLVIGK